MKGSPATSTAFRATKAPASCNISTSTWRTRCSNAASAGRRTRSPFGTIAVSSTTRCGITGRTPVPATGSPSKATARCKALFPQELLFGLLGEVLQFESDSGWRDGWVLSTEVGGYFVDNGLVAARLELGVDNPFAIGLGSVAKQPQAL